MSLPPAGTGVGSHRTVLIVDDQQEFRAVARSLLTEAGYRVVGEASTGAEATAAVTRLRPDVVLLDVELSDVDGFVVAEALALKEPPPAVVLTSSRDERSYHRRLSTSPARGFIPKERLSAETLRRVLE